MEYRLNEMKALDDLVYRGWRNQMNMLIIFAGLFSVTVTLTFECYKSVLETPTDTLARLQLRAPLDTTHDPAIDHLPPTSLSLILIKALWFASLALALVAFFIGILCKQWLSEYEKCDSFAAKKLCLIRGLRYPGLRAWRAPGISTFLPILSSVFQVLVLVGLHVWFWSFLSVVGFIVSTMGGLTVFLLLGKAIVQPPPLNSISTRG